MTTAAITKSDVRATSLSASTELDHLCINTIRTLAMDAVQQAKSGHPGTPMALAPLAYVIWHLFLRFDPEDPIWPNRDRFVLSNGHASMLLYAILHLSGPSPHISHYLCMIWSKAWVEWNADLSWPRWKAQLKPRRGITSKIEQPSCNAYQRCVSAPAFVQH
jgi:Transketolase, thiamine diphosphate binding domain